MTSTDRYITLLKPSEDELFKDKGSKFIGYAYPVDQLDRISELLELVKAKHPKAQHCCYAWRLGYGVEPRYRVNDDGEPKNSAGQPIYGQILSKELTNTIVMVVRYFGGTKLGVSGLINAYKTTAELTLDRAELITMEVQVELQLNFRYQDINKVMRIIKARNLRVKSQKMELTCEYVISVNTSQLDELLGIFKGWSSIDVQKI